MTKKLLILSAGVVGLLAASALPASAQVQDFFCNTFTIGCPDAPPPPAPIPVQATDPAPAPVKAKHHAKKKKVAKTKEAKADKGDKADKADATESK